MFRPLTNSRQNERKETDHGKNMLGVTLREVRGPLKDLMDKLCGEDWNKWLEAFKLFLRGEPTWAEEMIYPLLEWSSDLGQVYFDRIQDYISLHKKVHGDGWRLPTNKELSRALKITKPDGFIIGNYYWSSTKDICGEGYYTVVYTYDGCGGVGQACSRHIGRVSLRLCRPIKLPE